LINPSHLFHSFHGMFCFRRFSGLLAAVSMTKGVEN
jgi:hypothetical protein